VVLISGGYGAGAVLGLGYAIADGKNSHGHS
jgi:hypothetical protein